MDQLEDTNPDLTALRYIETQCGRASEFVRVALDATKDLKHWAQEVDAASLAKHREQFKRS